MLVWSVQDPFSPWIPRDFLYHSKNLRKPFEIFFVETYTSINLSGPNLNVFCINHFITIVVFCFYIFVENIPIWSWTVSNNMTDCCGNTFCSPLHKDSNLCHSFEHKPFRKSILLLRPRYPNKSKLTRKSKFKVSHEFQYWKSFKACPNGNCFTVIHA